MERHFVIFFSPGTFCAEHTERPINSWDVDTAVEMAKGIKERHSAVPYGFQFITRARSDEELDSKVVRRSGTHFLGGEILTLEQVKARNDPKDKILIGNMEGNGWNRVVVNTNSWQWTQPFEDGDVLTTTT